MKDLKAETPANGNLSKLETSRVSSVTACRSILKTIPLFFSVWQQWGGAAKAIHAAHGLGIV